MFCSQLAFVQQNFNKSFGKHTETLTYLGLRGIQGAFNVQNFSILDLSLSEENLLHLKLK